MAKSMIFEQVPPASEALRRAVGEAYRMDESRAVERILDAARQGPATTSRIADRARDLIENIRDDTYQHSGIEALLKEYDLSSDEGVMLMCLAEALLRVPDTATVDHLIRDKVTACDWGKHLGKGRSLLVNASTWGLLMTGRVMDAAKADKHFTGVLQRWVTRAGEPLVRAAATQAMEVVGRVFVLGRTIDEALERSRAAQENGYRHSYDMLGEAARTQQDATTYFKAYGQAIRAIGAHASSGGKITDRPGISVKLSALHPRYEIAHHQRVMDELLPRLKALCLLAQEQNIGLCVDAEEAARLDLSLDLVEAISGDPDLAGWEGFGLAVQAYQKRAFPLIDWLLDMARRHQRRLMVRLVKGAYWDSEIKDTQIQGLADYPVFTRKEATDASWLACAGKLLAAREQLYPQFATHNAYSVAAILELAGEHSAGFEFQRLHGMGEALYRQIVGTGDTAIPCRIYAPVGTHEELLAYLVRRLLENGANSSFVNRLQDDTVAIDDLVLDPAALLRSQTPLRHPRIPLPLHLYGEQRNNSRGIDLSDRTALSQLAEAMSRADHQAWRAAPLIAGELQPGEERPVCNPADREHVVGRVVWATTEHCEKALATTYAATESWAHHPATQRAAILERIADTYESHQAELMMLCVREAGKSVADALAEVREACDFCRYYAAQARAHFAAPMAMPGPTGETNTLSLHGRGLFLCISPWNFPLAIFTGQISAALAAGNSVIAKPAEQTSLIATRAVQLMHQAGVPADVLALLPGVGEVIGPPLAADSRIAGVAFTGSTQTAHAIHRILAERDGPIVPLIAETGGQNAMIVDSTALPEQVIADVVQSAFYSAGQRCSALRVLYLQEDIAGKMTRMLQGAMAELTVGDPALLRTDIGPVIDGEQLALLQSHVSGLRQQGRLIAEANLLPETARGTFLAPVAFQLDSISQLTQEVFGPVLHVVRYPANQLSQVIRDINNTGYGLTLGVHTRINQTIDDIATQAHVGNLYVNRNMIGATVGTQPFGGEGLSGTGFKAGGPHYLLRYATERVLTVNTAAAGGNASLFSLDDHQR